MQNIFFKNQLNLIILDSISIKELKRILKEEFFIDDADNLIQWLISENIYLIEENTLHRKNTDPNQADYYPSSLENNEITKEQAKSILGSTNKNEISIKDIEKISKKNNISPLSLQCIACINNLIEFNEKTLTFTSKIEEDFLYPKDIVVDKNKKKEMNRNRSLLSNFMYEKSGGSVSFANEGTGYGKSYNSINGFINTLKSKDEKENQVLIFTTPQKMQIDIDKNLIEELFDMKVNILMSLSQEDITNPDFKHWNEPSINNLKIFSKWQKKYEKCRNKNEFIYNEISHLNNALLNIKKSKEDIEGSNDEAFVLEEKNKIISLKRNIASGYKNLCTIILDKYESTQEVFTSKGNDVEADIIKFFYPFEYAKYYDCLILMTTDKSDFNINYFRLNKRKEAINRFTVASESLDYLIGKKEDPSKQENSRISELVSLPTNKERENILKNHIFKKKGTDDNFYNTRFHLIIDEEHVAYGKFLDRKISTIISGVRDDDKKINISHILSTLHRFKENAIVEEDKRVLLDVLGKRDFEIQESKITIAKDILFNKIEEIAKKEFESDKFSVENIKEYLAYFANNINHLTIYKSSFEQVTEVARNAFNFTTKHFYNEEELVKLKIRPFENKTKGLIYIENEKNKQLEDLNMKEFFQFILCIMQAFNKIEKKHIKVIKDNVKQGEGANQNNHLSSFINACNNNREALNHVFDRISKNKIPIDEVFTYMQPKTVFSIERSEDQTELDTGFVKVDLIIQNIQELPEISIARMLYDNDTNIIMLSATTGYKNFYINNYNREAIISLSDKYNLNLDIRERKENELNIIESIRKERLLIRQHSPEIFPYSEDTFETGDREQDKEIKSLYAMIENQYYGRIHRFKKKEFQRGVHAVVMSAFEGKNTIMLSISNDLSNTLKNIANNESLGKLKAMDINEKTKSEYVTLYKPKDAPYYLKVITLNSDAVKKEGDFIKEQMSINNERERVVIVSSYNSAGTGVNLYLTSTNTESGEEIEKDFDRLFLTGTPLYSQVIDKKLGIRTTNNYISILKYITENKTKFLSDIGSHIFNEPEYADMLYRNHRTSILHTIIQAVGRIERKDAIIKSEVYIPKDFYQEVAFLFSEIRNLRDPAIENLSMLNTELRNSCFQHLERKSFKDNQSRVLFEQKIKNNSNKINNFFSEDMRKYFKEIREGKDKTGDILRLNNLIRSEISFENPNKLIDGINEINLDNTRKTLAQTLFIDKSKIEDVEIGYSIDDNENDSQPILSDAIHSKRIYDPYTIFPNYMGLDEGESSVCDIINKFSDLREKKVFSKLLPHPAFLDVLKGNVGEAMVIEAVNRFASKKVKDITSSLTQYYEMFDMFLEINGNLLCIDAKYWNNNREDKERVESLIEKTVNKSKKIKEELKGKYGKIEFLVINTDINKNNINTFNNIRDDLNFINLFVLTPLSIKNKEKGKNTVVDRYSINETLIETINFLETK